MSRIDSYTLARSTTATITGREEVTKNLALTSTTTANEGSIVGTVTTNLIPLADATISILDAGGNPIAHTSSSATGAYTIPTLLQGSYWVTATKNGYLTTTPIPAAVVPNTATGINIDLEADPSTGLNTIYGRIRQLSPQSVIENATVTIFKITGITQTLIDTTKSNSYGQYLVPYLDDGKYIVVANKLGYDETTSSTITLSGETLVNVDIFLVVNPFTNTGTVSGLITDETTNAPIPNAAVALYLLTPSDIETIVQITKTNSAGLYLFGNVSEGTYLVKAMVQMIEV